MLIPNRFKTHKYILNQKRTFGLLLSLVSLITLGFCTNAYAVSRISASPSLFTLDEGGSSQVVTITLDEPIISDSGTPYVTLNFTSSDSSATNITPSTLNFTSSDWYVPQQITIDAPNNDVYGSSEDVTVSTVAESNSEYYSGFTLDIPVTVDYLSPPLAPGIVNQSLSLATDSSATVNVLNGVSGSPNASTLAIVSGPNHGSSTINNSGNITYTPTDGYSGPDSLVYTICSSIDSAVCSTATLSFNVASATTDNTSAPDTGFGIHKDNAWKVTGEYGLIATGLLALSLAGYAYLKKP